MINGIIKLFYSEVVKAKMKNLPSPSSEYKLRDECKDIQNITLKIDSVFFKGLKLIFGVLILFLAFNIKFILGIEVFLLEITYVIYKRNLEVRIKDSLDEKGKSGINLLASLIIIGILTGFNYIIVISFLTVFLFTIKHICSNIK